MRSQVVLSGLLATIATASVALFVVFTPTIEAQSTVIPTVESRQLFHSDRLTSASSVELQRVQEFSMARLDEDLLAVEHFLPAYQFWQHIFTIPDGHIAFGSAKDGRLIVTVPTRGNWAQKAVWADESLSGTLDGKRLPSRLRDRREALVQLLEPKIGPLVHNPTRGRFVTPHARRFGSFLGEWSTIYERFGVPSEIGLAQAMLESGLNGRARSQSRALGFCQFLSRNWRQLDRLSPEVIEAYNQTTQAPYCAAYLTILTTMYGSFLPALSEHHAGGVNVGRTLINGERIGGSDTREQYLLGAEFSGILRGISLMRYRRLYRTFGRRSRLYSEMVFGNTVNVTRMMNEYPQQKIFAMRVPRSITLAQVTKRTGLSVTEVKRFNPALVKRVPVNANLYLPSYVEEFGKDVTFWQRPPSTEYVEVLHDFLKLESGLERWHSSSFEVTLNDFHERFLNTNTEEGSVMATVITYMTGQLRRSRRGPILEEFRNSKRILTLFEQGLGEMEGASWLKENGSCASSSITEASPPPKSVTHRVQRGDTLGAIARRYGTTVGSIQGANGMGRSTRIGIGEQLQISGTAIRNVTYRVQRGDTLGAIARRYGTTVGVIQRANGMGRSTRIGIGKQLQISGSSVSVDSHRPSKPFAVAIGKLLVPECYLEEPLV
jgi:LysM repeat protein